MKGNKFIKIIYWALGITFLFTIISYLINFYGHVFSKKSEDWGVFGDYFGGILNPITAAINILVFIYLTKVISETEEKMHQRNLDFQKNLSLAELKHSSYIELTKHLESLADKMLNVHANTRFETTLLMQYIKGFFENMSHLFPVLENKENTQPILLKLKSISETLNQIAAEKDEAKLTDLRNTLTELVKSYYVDKQTLIKILQVEMIK